MKVHGLSKEWRILQVVSSSATSGAERHLVLLSRMLQQQGHYVLTACPPHEWLPAELQRAGVNALPLPMRGPGAAMTLLRLARVVREQRIDIIHTHLTRAAYYGLLLGLLTRKPVVSTVHVFTSDPAYRWLSRMGNPLIAVSEAVRRWLIEYGVRASAVQTVYNATDFVSLNGAYADAPRAVRREFALPLHGRLIGVFAKVVPIKGHDLLIESLPRVLEIHPETFVLFVGSADSEFAVRARRRVESLRLNKHVIFTGLRTDVARLMEAVDVVVMPSRSETFGLAVLEAMALGKPVIATRVGGLPELVRDGETGILVDFTAASLAHALDELLASADLRVRLGETARTLVCRHYTPERMVQHVESVYARALTA
jgi:glycosyltransferase involved in cell wall biosynthesis